MCPTIYEGNSKIYLSKGKSLSESVNVCTHTDIIWLVLFLCILMYVSNTKCFKNSGIPNPEQWITRSKDCELVGGP